MTGIYKINLKVFLFCIFLNTPLFGLSEFVDDTVISLKVPGFENDFKIERTQVFDGNTGQTKFEYRTLDGYFNFSQSALDLLLNSKFNSKDEKSPYSSVPKGVDPFYYEYSGVSNFINGGAERSLEQESYDLFSQILFEELKKHTKEVNIKDLKALLSQIKNPELKQLSMEVIINNLDPEYDLGDYENLLRTLKAQGFSQKNYISTKPICSFRSSLTASLHDLTYTCIDAFGESSKYLSDIDRNKKRREIYSSILGSSEIDDCSLIVGENIFDDSPLLRSSRMKKIVKDAEFVEGLSYNERDYETKKPNMKNQIRINYKVKNIEEFYGEVVSALTTDLRYTDINSSIAAQFSEVEDTKNQDQEQNSKFAENYRSFISKLEKEARPDLDEIERTKIKLKELEGEMAKLSPTIEFVKSPNALEKVKTCVNKALDYNESLAPKSNTVVADTKPTNIDPNFESFYTQVDAQWLKISYQTKHCGSEKRDQIKKNIGPIYKKILSDTDYFDSKPMELTRGHSSWDLCKQGENSFSDIKIYEVQEPGNDTTYTLRKLKAKQ